MEVLKNGFLVGLCPLDRFAHIYVALTLLHWIIRCGLAGCSLQSSLASSLLHVLPSHEITISRLKSQKWKWTAKQKFGMWRWISRICMHPQLHLFSFYINWSIYQYVSQNWILWKWKCKSKVNYPRDLGHVFITAITGVHQRATTPLPLSIYIFQYIYGIAFTLHLYFVWSLFRNAEIIALQLFLDALASLRPIINFFKIASIELSLSQIASIINNQQCQQCQQCL